MHSPADALPPFRSLTPDGFERACAMLLQDNGYGESHVTRKGPKGGDGGVDVIVRDESGAIVALCQCKRWNNRPTSGLMHVIRELAGSMAREHVSRGILMTTVHVTPFERREAAILKIKVIDADGLTRMAQGSVDHPTAVPHQPLTPRTANPRSERRAWAVHAFIASAASVLLIVIVALIVEYRREISGFLAVAVMALAADTGRRRRARRRNRRQRPGITRRHW